MSHSVKKSHVRPAFTLLLGLSALAPFSSLSGCGGSEDSAPTAASETAAAAKALGGSDALLAVQAQALRTSGKHYDREEAYGLTGDTDLVQTEFECSLSARFSDAAQRAEWSALDVGLVPGLKASWTEVSAGQLGYVDGQDNLFQAPGKHPMLSSQVTARWKQLVMSSPGYLVRYALENPASVQKLQDATWSGRSYRVLSLSGVPAAAQPVRLFLDPQTHLVAKAETLEDDPIHGDSLYEVAYEDWRAADGVQAPFKLTHSYVGSPVQIEQRTSLAHSPSLAADAFNIPADQKGRFDSGLAEWGKRSSQYLARFQGILLPSYADAGGTVTETVVSATAGAGLVMYSAGGYNTLVVELPTYLVVVEAPLYDSVSRAVITKIKQRFVGKPIQYVVNTHFHFDHSGGLRTYAAEGAEVLVASQVRDYFDASMKAPHTLNPDTLARSPRAVPVTGVASSQRLTDGARTVALYNIKQSHSDGHLIVHVEDAKLLFVTDLYSPGLLGPNPMSAAPGRLNQIAKDLLKSLSELQLDETKVTVFVGGHGGAAGTFAELRTFAK